VGRSIAGFNTEAKKGKDAARKYCQLWQTELTKTGADLVVQLTKKMLSQASYNDKRAALNKSTEDLNKCIKLINSMR